MDNKIEIKVGQVWGTPLSMSPFYVIEEVFRNFNGDKKIARVGIYDDFGYAVNRIAYPTYEYLRENCHLVHDDAEMWRSGMRNTHFGRFQSVR